MALERFALDALNLGEMTIEVVLEAFGARELDVDGLQRLEAGADVRKERRRRFVNLGEVALVLHHGVLFVLDRCRAPVRVGQACLNLRHLIWQGCQPRLRTLQRRELLLRVADLGRQAVAGDPCLFEIRLAVNLCGKPVIDVAAQIVQRPQAGMHLLHEREPRREEIQPAGELFDLRPHRDCPLRHVAGVGDPRRELAHRRFELRRVAHEDPRLLDERSELQLLLAQFVRARPYVRIRRFTGVELGLDGVDFLAPADQPFDANRGSTDLAVQLAEARIEGREERLSLLDPGNLGAERVSAVRKHVQPVLQRRERPFAGSQRRELAIRICQAGFRCREPLAERVDLAAVHGQPIEMALHGVQQFRRTLVLLARPSRRTGRSRDWPPSSFSVTVRCSRSSRDSVLSTVAATVDPSRSLAIWASISQTISLTRRESSSARSIVCCWFSSALSLALTRSASAFKAWRSVLASSDSTWHCERSPSLPSSRSIVRSATATSS